MSLSFKVEGVPISAKRDRAMFNSFAGDKSYVLKGIDGELAVSYSSVSFEVSLGTGEAVICGGSMTSDGTDTLTLEANEQGYLAIEIDTIQTGSNICQFKKVTTLTQEDINSNGFVYDLPLYQYTTNSNGVASMVDKRLLLRGSNDEIQDEIDELNLRKQDKLVAGSRIRIDGGALISATNQFIPENTTNDIGYLTSQVDSGLYFFNNVADLPEGSYGVGLVTVPTGDRAKQIFIRTGTKNSNEQFIYQRSYQNGWGQWYKYCPVFTPVSTSPNATVHTAEWCEVASMDFPVNSIYLVTFGGTWQNKNGGTIRAFCFTDDTAGFARDKAISSPPITSGTLALNGFAIVDCITTAVRRTFTLYGYQDSGSDVNAYGMIRAIRVG